MIWTQRQPFRTLLDPARAVRRWVRRERARRVVRRADRREADLRRRLHLDVEPADRIRVSCSSERASPVGAAIVTALGDALGGRVELPAAVRAMEGMSGQTYRSFVNRLFALHPDPHYLEIGSWAGSTAVAALHGNRARALCIDNWSQFGGPREAFFRAIESVRSDRLAFDFLERDFRSVDYRALAPFNVYLFDGPHEEADHYDGVTLVQPALATEHVLIVDDWNWRGVRLGTLAALADTGCRLRTSFEVRTSLDDTQPVLRRGQSDWHNGYFVAEVVKGGAGSA